MANKPEVEVPDLSMFKTILTPEKLALIKNSPERSAFVKEYSAKLANDPSFMKLVEGMLKPHAHQAESSALVSEFQSYGWEPTTISADAIGSAAQPKRAGAAAAAAMVAQKLDEHSVEI